MGSKYWCFTLKVNDDNRELEVADTQKLLKLYTKFYIFQLESGANTSYLHFQGYFELQSKQRISYLKRKLWNDAHFEKAKGTAEQNVEYCSKSNTKVDGPWTEGEPRNKGQGARNDLAIIKEKIKAGTPVPDLAEEHFTQWVRYRRAFEEYSSIVNPTVIKGKFALSDFAMEPFHSVFPHKAVHLFGATETGKTQFALAHFQKPLFIRHMDVLGDLNPRVHDGLVFDDMEFDHMPPTAVIHLLDLDMPSDIHIRYKTAFIPAGFPRIFTSNGRDIWYKPDTCASIKEAIERRIFRWEISRKLF